MSTRTHGGVAGALHRAILRERLAAGATPELVHGHAPSVSAGAAGPKDTGHSRADTRSR